MEQPKSGFKTTEFIVTLILALTSVGVAGGFLSSDEASQINQAGQVAVTEGNEAVLAIIELVKVVAPIVASAVAAVAYIWSRTKVKLGG